MGQTIASINGPSLSHATNAHIQRADIACVHQKRFKIDFGNEESRLSKENCFLKYHDRIANDTSKCGLNVVIDGGNVVRYINEDVLFIVGSTGPIQASKEIEAFVTEMFRLGDVNTPQEMVVSTKLNQNQIQELDPFFKARSLSVICSQSDDDNGERHVFLVRSDKCDSFFEKVKWEVLHNTADVLCIQRVKELRLGRVCVTAGIVVVVIFAIIAAAILSKTEVEEPLKPNLLQKRS